MKGKHNLQCKDTKNRGLEEGTSRTVRTDEQRHGYQLTSLYALAMYERSFLLIC